MDDNLSLKQKDINKEDTLHFVIKLDNRNNSEFQQLANNIGNVKLGKIKTKKNKKLKKIKN